MARRYDHLVRLRPHPDVLHVSQGRTVLTMGPHGFVDAACTPSGLFVYETRLLSRLCWQVGGQAPLPVALSNVSEHSWLGYYLVPTLGPPQLPPDEGSGLMREESERSLELRLGRFVGGGMHEDVDLANYTQRPQRFELVLELEADFCDQAEVGRPRRQRGVLRRSWSDAGGGLQVRFAYHAQHRRDGTTAQVDRGLVVKVLRASTPPRFVAGRVVFAVELAPLATWHACLAYEPHIEGTILPPSYRCGAFLPTDNELDRRREAFAAGSTRLGSPASASLAPVVATAFAQAKRDLLGLRLYDLDRADGGWTVAAGLPLYLALYGRDVLTAAWQAALLGPELMSGSLTALAELQGRRHDAWRDEAPGRMLHEAHTGPLAALELNPRRRYYGSITTSGFYAVVLAELWHWTGDPARVRPFVAPALGALRYLDRECRDPGHGFYAYHSRSPQGVRHQGWKDSPDAIVYADGTPAAPPIATCEEQAFVYLAKLELSEVLWWLGDRALAQQLYAEARELRRGFHDAFWMERLGFYALGLDGAGRQIDAITSNPGHCLAAGIVERPFVERTATRLLQDDLFSGWGIRTLSAANPAYNPFSYHRGSVWPVEQGSFAFGMARYGLHQHVDTLCRAQFEAARLFVHCRLPEVFSGHARDPQHPFPALYPQANSPQAWSASVVFSLLQALLGLYPYAPLEALLIDPHLPAWLPELTLEGLRVGRSVVSLRFWRRDGHTAWQVLDQQGPLHVLRQPSPWSLTAGFAERARDVVASLLH